MSEDDSDDDWFESAFDEGADDEQERESTTDETALDTDDSDDPFGAGDDAAVDAGADPFEDDGDTPFEEDGADPFGGDVGAGAGPEDESFTEDADPFGDGSADDEGGLFEDDFSNAMASAGPGDGGGGEDLDEADFDSDIPRIDLGIEGLDNMIVGGIPQRHLMVVIGSPGTGKTTFGLQFLYHGLQQGQKAVFITLEQSRQAIVDTADERGWDFEQYAADDELAVVDLDPVEMANSLDNIRGELPELIREFDADRLVLDSVSLLEMMYEDQAKRRTEVFDFTRSLKSAGVTTMLTSEADEDNPYVSRHGIIEYLTDAVFVLQYVRGDASETRLAVEIQKIRNANHSRATKPYDITLDGIDVYDQASIF